MRGRRAGADLGVEAAEGATRRIAHQQYGGAGKNSVDVVARLQSSRPRTPWDRCTRLPDTLCVDHASKEDLQFGKRAVREVPESKQGQVPSASHSIQQCKP
jgi:hypothetical protein